MLKPIRLSDQTTCISPYDPAVDTDASDWKTYGAKMLTNPVAWREYIKTKPGETLTEFEVGVIPTDQLVKINDECQHMPEQVRSEELRWRAFLHGLRGIKGWEGEVPKKTVNGVEYVDPAWLAKTFVRGLAASALFVGMIALAFNRLTEEEIKN